jgi:hypothetical protein
MKMIYLSSPTTIGKVVVTPQEGVQYVSDEKAAELKAEGLLAGEPEEIPASAYEDPKPKRGAAPK